MPEFTINLGDGLSLPDEAVTETFAILGKRGAGKTSTARVLCEELLAAQLPVAVLDPTGVWWGLRSSADGQGDGYPVVIFGGDHADVPLQETAGAVIADVIVDQRVPAVLDLSLLTKSAARRFCIDFLERLYHRNRDPLHLVVDEADLLAPQRIPPGAERLLGAMDDVVRRGRVRGLGVTLITQRPAVLNKDVLGQAEVLVSLRMTGVRDVHAIDEWVRLHADEDQAREVKASLPSLPIGTAWFWSPGWLGILRRIEVRRPRTYDSSATPRPGQSRPAVRSMAAVDLEALGEQIAATVERAKAEDPKALRARIAELERSLAKAQSATPEPVRVEVPVLTEANVESLREAGADLTAVRDQLDLAVREAHEQITAALDRLGPTVDAIAAAGQCPPPAAAAGIALASTPAARVAPTPRQASESGPLPKAQRAILTALAQHGRRTVTQVALLTGYSHSSGGYRNSLSALRTAGFIEGRGDIAITDAGLDALGPYEPLPTGQALVDWWKAHHLGKAERAILDVLAERYPSAVSVQEIADATGYSAGSGGFRNSLSRLRSLELASGRGELSINPTLLEAAPL